MTQTKALKLALKNAEAIVISNLPQDCPDCEATMVWVHSMAQSIVQSIKEALAQPKQRSISEHLEPVAVKVDDASTGTMYVKFLVDECLLPVGTQFYTTPPQRKSLTDAEFAYVWREETGRIMGTDKALLLRAKQITEAAHYKK